ncbi:helix-turn-helix transcriptional regulator [Alkalibacter rhizosphaerae]|uniref:Helix-turn-helix transcriptional regulator n=1 Tax=Alkalibacter rhizosphaerae TaxID=2815577 RepID=A0A974XGW9_9FIRM|nr:helix-turn-helix transcriptional regulator [Alkalibacter rhizosphaerae]QSX09566.1 helix-turn-helix transcriptional regulator [Alkalibacter rhizosphaerae]
MSPNQFGEFIANKRKEKEISLRGMAELLDLSPAYWSDIEKGRRNPPNLIILQQLANILGLSNGELDEMVDMASDDRDEIPMDLPQYIKESDLARTALRKARKKSESDGSESTTKAWEDFIKALDEEQ